MESRDPLGPLVPSGIDLDQIHPNNRNHPLTKLILKWEEEIFALEYETDQLLKQAEAEGCEQATALRKMMRL